MIIRKLLPDEMHKIAIVSSVAFEFPLDYEKALENNDEKNEPVNGLEDIIYAGLADDNESIYGGMGAYPYEVRYDGTAAMMLGIGGVCTLPPYRRNGVIRECFKLFFKESYEKGIPLSYLYPFSRSYYRMFGYESNSRVMQWEIDFKALKPFNVGGRTEMLMPDSDHDAVDKVYSAMHKEYNMSVVRRKDDYKYFYKRGTFSDQRYAYIRYNKNDEPDAFIMFKKETVDGKNIMNCTHTFPSKNDFLFSDIEGFKGLIDFVLSFASNYDAIRFTLPEHINIEGLIRETNFATCKAEQAGMVRVIDVEKVLNMSRYIGTGSVVIRIDDANIEQNNATFTVNFENGACKSVEKSDAECDASMDISTFSALILGSYADLENCLKEDLTINGNLENLKKVFYGKKNRIIDLF